MTLPAQLLETTPTPRRPWRYDIPSLLIATERFCLQFGHRVGTVALFAMLAAWALLYRGQSYHWPLAIAFAGSNLGFCAALLARIIARGRSREALGLIIFNLLILALSLQLMLLSRLDVIRAAAERFFSPT
ncbi:MAG TPA: hypothetical protein VLI90_19425 [Tepidisphaeraceae bacterium]|nr:hypothetical protein [Tepidisphaeraceae bacterium]